MRSLKSVLAMIVAVCLMMCLAVPAFATTEPSVLSAADDTAAPEATEDAVPEDTEEPLPEETEEPLPEETEDALEGEEEAEEEGSSVFHTVLLILEVIASALLILVILLQSGKEAGLSGALAGNSDSYMSKNGKGGLDKKLASATKWIALVWILLTLALTLIP